MSQLFRWLTLVLIMMPMFSLAKVEDPFAGVCPTLSSPKEVLRWYSVEHCGAEDVVTWLHHHSSVLGVPKKLSQRSCRNKDSPCFFGADIAGKQVWLRASESTQKEFTQLLAKIDQPKQQILVEARIVRVNRDIQSALGLRWGTQGALHTTDQYGLRINLPQAPQSDYGLAIPIGHFADGQTLDLELSALEAMGEGEIIAMPHLLVSEGQEALIESGLRIPYQHQTNKYMSSIQFEKAVLSLSVRVNPMPGSKLAVTLTIHQDKPDSIASTLPPAITTQVLKTMVVIPNGQLIVLGGIYEYQCNQQEQSVPVLGRLPYLGRLFSHRAQQWSKSELLVFLQPTLIDIVSKND